MKPEGPATRMASSHHKPSSSKPARSRTQSKEKSKSKQQRIRVYIPKPMADAVATAAKIEGIDQSTFIARAAQAKVDREKEGRVRDPITSLCSRSAKSSGEVEPLIAFEGMIFGDPWCTEISIGDLLHLDKRKRKPLPGELIVIEETYSDTKGKGSIVRVHRLVSFDGRIWTLRSRRGQLVTLPDSDAAFWGVVTAITQIRTIEVARKTFDPWDELQGPCVGFVAPDPATSSKTRARN
jgi:hypothetical protein